MNRHINKVLVEIKQVLLEDTKASVVKALEKGYKKDGYQGMMLAAYKLEAHSTLKDVKKWMVGVLRDILDTGKIGETPVQLSKSEKTRMGMYRDDLRHGRS